MSDQKDKGFSATNTEAPQETNTNDANFTDCLKSKQAKADAYVLLTPEQQNDAVALIHRLMVLGLPADWYAEAVPEDSPPGGIVLKLCWDTGGIELVVFGWVPTLRASIVDTHRAWRDVMDSGLDADTFAADLETKQSALALARNDQARDALRAAIASDLNARDKCSAAWLDRTEDLRNWRGAIPRNAEMAAKVLIPAGKAVH